MTNKQYWNDTTDAAIVEYNKSKDETLLMTVILPAVRTLSESIIRRFKNQYITSVDDLIETSVTDVISKLHMYNPNHIKYNGKKTSGFNYFSRLVKNNFILESEQNGKEWNRSYSIDSDTTDNVDSVLHNHISPHDDSYDDHKLTNDLTERLYDMLEWCDTANLSNRERKIVDLIRKAMVGEVPWIMGHGRTHVPTLWLSIAEMDPTGKLKRHHVQQILKNIVTKYKNRDVLPSERNKFVRICPTCNVEIIYVSRGAFVRANLYNQSCKSCGRRGKSKSIRPYVKRKYDRTNAVEQTTYTRVCPRCNTMISYSGVGSIYRHKYAEEKNSVCKHCSAAVAAITKKPTHKLGWFNCFSGCIIN